MSPIDSGSRLKAALVMSPMLPAQLGSIVEHYARQQNENISQRAYQLFEQRGGEPGRELDDWLAAEREQIPVDILQTTDALTVFIHLQGLEDAEVEVMVDEALILVARKKQLVSDAAKRDPNIRAESSSQLIRLIRLPCSIRPQKATLRIRDDRVIELILPRQPHVADAQAR